MEHSSSSSKTGSLFQKKRKVTRTWWISFGTIVVFLFSAQLVCARAHENAPSVGIAVTPETAATDTARAGSGQSRGLARLLEKTGFKNFFDGFAALGGAREPARSSEGARWGGLFPLGVGQIIMILVGLLLIYLAIKKKYEPLLLLPIGFGGILANIPVVQMAGPDGFLGIIYGIGVSNGLFPLLIFMGVGAMTDFGPLIANPKTAILGAAAQFGIFATLIGSLLLTEITGGIVDFSLRDAAAIGIIGGADGPTSIFVARVLAPDLLGAIAVAAYSYMALVPIIQPPIARLLTTDKERKVKMKQLRKVSRAEKTAFPLIVLGLCILLLPDATPLVGALMFGNLAKESGVVDRLSKTLQNELINIVTILLGLAVGSKLMAEQFLVYETLAILVLGLLAFSIGTASGVLMARGMALFSKTPLNPLIGAAGVSAVPMAARVVNQVGLEENKQNFLLMHAMGPNVAGVIGSAVAAGVLLALVG